MANATQIGFYAKYVKEKKDLDERYSMQLALARIVFRDDARAQARLMLLGLRKYAYNEWLRQISAFYHTLAADERLAMKIYPYLKKTEINTRIRQITRIKKLYYKFRIEDRDVQAATLVRDETIDQLLEWGSDFITVAKIALETHPKLLEEMFDVH